jgi:hypothetical protein
VRSKKVAANGNTPGFDGADWWSGRAGSCPFDGSPLQASSNAQLIHIHPEDGNYNDCRNVR